MSYRYQITVKHRGLDKERILTGNDKYILESRARELTARWNDQYAKRLAVAQRVADRQQRQEHIGRSLDRAHERTKIIAAQTDLRCAAVRLPMVMKY